MNFYNHSIDIRLNIIIFSDESFTKKYGRKNGKVNLVTLRKLACEQVYDNLASEWNRMWENEQVSDGIKKIQELTKESDPSKIAW